MAQLGQAIAAPAKLSEHSSPLVSTSSPSVVHSELSALNETGQENTLDDNWTKNAETVISEPLKVDSRPSVDHSELPSHTTSNPLVDHSELPIGEARVVGLTQKALARRLGRSDVAVINARRERDAVGFAEWSRKRDPKGLAWEYRGGRYYPIE